MTNGVRFKKFIWKCSLTKIKNWKGKSTFINIILNFVIGPAQFWRYSQKKKVIRGCKRQFCGEWRSVSGNHLSNFDSLVLFIRVWRRQLQIDCTIVFLLYTCIKQCPEILKKFGPQWFNLDLQVKKEWWNLQLSTSTLSKMAVRPW